MEVTGRGQTWARQESEHGGLAVWLSWRPRKYVQAATHGVAWQVPWIATWTHMATGTCRQTAPKSTHTTDTDL